MELHRLAGCGVSPTPNISADYFIALGDEVFDRQVQIRHGLVHTDHHPLVALDTGWLSAGTIMVVEVRRHILADYACVSLVHEVLEVFINPLFHLL